MLYLYTLLALAFVVAVVVFGVLSLATPSSTASRKLQVVAAENFWGSLLTQLGGSRVNVTTIISDPNADPHEYESTPADARSFASADYIVINGAGYDSWANKLVSSGTKAGSRVLTVAHLLHQRAGDNPHFWYSPDYVNAVVLQEEKDLEALSPVDTSYFRQQYKLLTHSLSTYQSRIEAIKSQYYGTKVASTETFFTYLASAAGLDVVSPSDFMNAVAEGNDPPIASVIAFQQQIKDNVPRVLVYNRQTITPLTSSIQSLAANQNIPTVAMSETVQPTGVSFQDWMNAQLIDLQNAFTPGKTNR